MFNDDNGNIFCQLLFWLCNPLELSVKVLKLAFEVFYIITQIWFLNVITTHWLTIIETKPFSLPPPVCIYFRCQSRESGARQSIQ